MMPSNGIRILLRAPDGNTYYFDHLKNNILHDDLGNWILSMLPIGQQVTGPWVIEQWELDIPNAR